MECVKRASGAALLEGLSEMESSFSQKDKKNEDVEEPLLNNSITKGGCRTLPFIIGSEAGDIVKYPSDPVSRVGWSFPHRRGHGFDFKLYPPLDVSTARQSKEIPYPLNASIRLGNEGCEKMASYGMMPNMILYMMNEYHLTMAAATNILYFKNAATHFIPLLGAFLADSLIGRFWCIGLGSIVCLLGVILLWLTAMIPQARPSHCDTYNSGCSPSTTPQLIFLCSSFALISIGAGGIRGSSLAFGADQLNKKQGIRKDEEGALESYVSWYYASTAFAIIFAFTFVVYITEHLGWKVGFGVAVILMFLSALSFFLASPFYVKLEAKKSLLTGLVQVIVSSYKNRHLTLSSECTNLLQFHNKGSALAFPSEKLRFVNKACIIKDPQQDLKPDGRASDPWSLCTVEQVEELKSLLKVIPVWSTGVLMSINISQASFPTLLARSMDRHVTSTFEIPLGSFGMFTVAAVALWVILYNRLVLPLFSRIMNRPVHFTPFQRMGFGILLSSLSVSMAAIVENVRRNIAIKDGYSEYPQAVVNMSALWLIPQHSLGGFAEAAFIIAQNEFYVSEFPKSMSSIATSMGGLGVSFGSLLASVLMNTIDRVTERDGNVSWVSSNINKGHYDYYYCVLAGLSFCNLMYFQVCCRAYCSYEEGKRVLNVGEEVEDD